MDLALSSILKEQTLIPNEVVLVEDGPLNKELYEVVDKYKKAYPNILKVYPLEKNGGLGPALNYGLSKCSNELIARMDSDDVSCKDRFEKQISYLSNHPEISVLGGAISEFEEDPNVPVRLKAMPKSYEEVKKYARFRNPVNHVTSCFRKTDIESVGSYKDMFYLEDHYLWSRLLVNKKKIENLVFFLIILIIVLVSINLIWGEKKENKQTEGPNKKLAVQDEYESENSEDKLSSQLENILREIDGVGKVKVLITYSQTSQTIPLYNEDTSQKDTEEKDTTGGTRKVIETDTKKDVIYQETNGNKTPITQSVISPKMEGAIVTAQGATNTNVKTNIIQAVEAVTGLATHKIQVFAMSES